MAEKLDATFFAFRKREGSLLLGASLVYVALTAVIFGVFVALNWGAFAAVADWFGAIIQASAESGGEPAADAIPTPPPALFGMLGGYVLVLLVYNIVLAAFEAACLRWMIWGERSGPFGFNLNAYTWRVYGAYWVWFFLNIASSLVVALLLGIAVIVFSSSGGSASTLEPLIRLIWNLVLIYFVVRLLPAAATSVGRRRFSFFEAWTVTRERFWALFGSFLILVLIYLLAAAVFFGGAFALIWPRVGEMAMALGPNPSEQQTMEFLGRLFAPDNLVVLGGAYVLIYPIYVVLLVLYYGINARAVRAALDEGKIEAEAAN